MNKIFFIITLSVCVIFLSGCHTNKSNFSDNELFSFFKPKESSVSENNPQPNISFKSEKKVRFLNFNKRNLNKNIYIAVSNYPAIESLTYSLDSVRSEKKIAESAKSTQISLQGNAGATRSNESNSLAAVGTFSFSKVLFFFCSIDKTVLSQEEKIQAAEEQLNGQAQALALNIYNVLFNLHKNQEIVELYRKGLEKGEPLINSIKNISVSGYADQSIILKAKKEYSELLVSSERAKVLLRNSEILFIDFFPNVEIPKMFDFKIIQVPHYDAINAKMIKNNPSINYQNYMIQSMQNSLDSLIAQQKPSVLLRAGISSPANNPLGDTSGNAGISVNYIYNDGGNIESQIESLNSQIESAKKQKDATIRQLKAQLKTTYQTYKGLMGTKKTLQDLVDLMKRNRDTIKAQLETGKTKIQDVLNAEVELAKKEIELISIDTELISASYTLKSLYQNLIPRIIR